MADNSYQYMYGFCPDISKNFGLLNAILLNYFYRWILSNKKNDINYFDGLYWVSRSNREIADDIGGVSYKKVQRTIGEMVEQNLIIIGNYNQIGYSTNWYTLTGYAWNLCNKKV